MYYFYFYFEDFASADPINANLEIGYSKETKQITVKSTGMRQKGEEVVNFLIKQLKVSPQWAETNQDMLRTYGYTIPEINMSDALITIQLDPKDKLLEAKQRLFSFGYIKNSSSEVDFGIKITSPKNELMLHKILTPFRINTWSHSASYIETVRIFCLIYIQLISEFQNNKNIVLPYARMAEYKAIDDLKTSCEKKLAEYTTSIEVSFTL